MKSKLLSFISGLLVTIVLAVITFFILTIYLDMNEFRSFVLFGDFFAVYEFKGDSNGFEFNISPIKLLPIGIIGGLISIALSQSLRKFITVK